MLKENFTRELEECGERIKKADYLCPIRTRTKIGNGGMRACRDARQDFRGKRGQ